MSKKEMNWDEFKQFVAEFRDETDRAAVILGAAKLDQALYQILRQRLLATTSQSDELLDNEAPLSTFHAKIALVYRLGLIDAPFVRALHIVRRIRNAFAHEVKGCTLNSGSHGDRVKELSTPFRNLLFYKQFRQHFFAEKTGPSFEFRACLAMMVGRLETLIEHVGPVDTGDVLPMIRPDWENLDALGKLKEGGAA